MELICDGKALVESSGEGEPLFAEVALSVWGGVDPATAKVIDQHHPLHGQNLAGRVLCIPGGRGSCSGSGVLLELILNGGAPAAIVVREPERILVLGALVAQLAFKRAIPVVQVAPELFATLGAYRHVRVEKGRLWLSMDRPFDQPRPIARLSQALLSNSDADGSGIDLTRTDRALLAGRHGKASRMAMRLLLKMAALDGADALVDVSQVHIDACIDTGPASLRLAHLLLKWGARVRVPTTLNAVSVDLRRWRAQGVDEERGARASAIAEAYIAMGAMPSFTCAPYLLDSAPRLGEQVGWAESNAVAYANSVLGARTMKYPDYLDICIALTGRAPLAGCHLKAGRQATLALEVEFPKNADDLFWPLLGYCCGSVCGTEIPLILGVESSAPGSDELKAFAAAFATMAASPMFHIAGVTPEADEQKPGRRMRVSLIDLFHAWEKLNTAKAGPVGLVSMGSPHFSLSECGRLAELTRGRTRSPKVAVIVTCGRRVHEAAMRAGHILVAEAFGVRFLTDTCWCMLSDPIVPAGVRTLMTNSAKYAHYAPGLVGRQVRLDSMAACIEAACTGWTMRKPPLWLAG